MAEVSTPSTEIQGVKPVTKAGQEFWALAALGAAALFCVTLLAVALTLLLRGGSTATPIQISNIGNTTAPAVAPVVVKESESGIHRPSEPAKPQSERASAMDRTQPALPGVVASPTPPGGQRQIALTRADPPSPPSPLPQPTVDAGKVGYRMRADPNSLYKGQNPPPMPVQYAPDPSRSAAGAEGRSTVQGAASDFSYAPDVAFVEQGLRTDAMDVQVSKPFKTSSLDGFRTKKGFQFFRAELLLKNISASPIVLNDQSLVVSDTDGVEYKLFPELMRGEWPTPSLAAGAECKLEATFQVQEITPLKSLSIQEAPGRAVVVPLQAR